MYKKVFILAVLTAALVFFVKESNGVPATSITRPGIVAKIRMTGQTATIPTTTVFTPAQSGLFRATAYMSMTVPSGGGGGWAMSLNWTDDAGSETAYLAELGTISTPPYAYATSELGDPASSITFYAVSGIPVSYFIGNGPGGTYDAFLVVERLE
jgi:hypothetical protein